MLKTRGKPRNHSRLLIGKKIYDADNPLMCGRVVNVEKFKVTIRCVAPGIPRGNYTFPRKRVKHGTSWKASKYGRTPQEIAEYLGVTVEQLRGLALHHRLTIRQTAAGLQGKDKFKMEKNHANKTEVQTV